MKTKPLDRNVQRKKCLEYKYKEFLQITKIGSELFKNSVREYKEYEQIACERMTNRCNTQQCSHKERQIQTGDHCFSYYGNIRPCGLALPD